MTPPLPPPGDGPARLLIAPFEHVDISRRLALIEPLSDLRLRITNLGRSRPLLLNGAAALGAAQAEIVAPPVRLAWGKLTLDIVAEGGGAAGGPIFEREPGSVSVCLQDLRRGDDPLAAGELWKRYFHRLEAVARSRLGRSSVRIVDGEDVAADVFHRLCRGMSQGRFPNLGNRDDLWRLLVVLTRQRVVDEIREHEALKRGGGQVVSDSVLGSTVGGGAGGLDECLSEAPSPETLAALSEEFDILMARLPDDESRLIVQLRMEGYANEEIARSVDLSLRTVERKLAAVREAWSRNGS